MKTNGKQYKQVEVYNKGHISTTDHALDRYVGGGVLLARSSSKKYEGINPADRELAEHLIKEWYFDGYYCTEASFVSNMIGSVDCPGYLYSNLGDPTTGVLEGQSAWEKAQRRKAVKKEVLCKYCAHSVDKERKCAQSDPAETLGKVLKAIEAYHGKIDSMSSRYHVICTELLALFEIEDTLNCDDGHCWIVFETTTNFMAPLDALSLVCILLQGHRCGVICPTCMGGMFLAMFTRFMNESDQYPHLQAGYAYVANLIRNYRSSSLESVFAGDHELQQFANDGDQQWSWVEDRYKDLFRKLVVACHRNRDSITDYYVAVHRFVGGMARSSTQSIRYGVWCMMMCAVAYVVDHPFFDT